MLLCGNLMRFVRDKPFNSKRLAELFEPERTLVLSDGSF